ncbi:Putative Pol polyprotein, partial [Buceros rhinoceros silvestris]
WPLSAEHLAQAYKLVQAELDAGHLEESTSPWNTPIFVIPKKVTGKWRLLHDLTAVNNQMMDMGPQQPGLPKVSMLPTGWPVIVLDIKDCFFSIPLHPQDRMRFAFSLLPVNLSGPSLRYQWTVLPQGMKNSPTICQRYVANAIQPIRKAYPQVPILHYMDDILIAAPDEQTVEKVFEQMVARLAKHKLYISEATIQKGPSVKYLGTILSPTSVKPQLLSIDPQVSTLNDLQRPVGALQWVRQFIPVPEDWMVPFYQLL